MYSAHHFGISFLGRNAEGLEVSVLGRRVFVRILCSIEFTSHRKRSSILCQVCVPKELGNGQADSAQLQSKIFLFTKGADSVVLPLLKDRGEIENATVEAMQEYALDGLRTLCIAKKEVHPSEFVEWFKRYREAEQTNFNRQERIEE